MSHSQEFLDRRTHSRVRFHRTLFVLFLALIVWMAIVVGAGLTIFQHTSRAAQTLVKARSQAFELSFADARESLRQAQADLARAVRWLPALRSIGWVPGVGSQLSLSSDAIRSLSSIVGALIPMVDLGEDLRRLADLPPTMTFEDLPTETKRAILNRLAGAAGDLDVLAAQLELAQLELTMLAREATLAPMLSAIDPLRDDLAQTSTKLELLRPATHVLPAFAGLDKPATNLLLFLNNDELRPAGGFIGSYGVMRAYGGDIEALETADVYAMDDAAASRVTTVPPYPLASYNQATKWFFRDANWSPDVALSSQKAVELFLDESAATGLMAGIPTASAIDNVMAFTPTYAADLLAITGSITVGGQTFTKDNVAELLEYQVEYGYAREGKPPAQRKEILADLVSAMKARLYALPLSRWGEVTEATQRALREKQFMLYSTHADVQAVLVNVGWAGVVAPPSSDAVMVVDANLASLKSDPAVERHITYVIEKAADDKWLGRVTIEYTHTGTFDWRTTRYRTYTRLLTPLGSKLVGVTADGALIPSDAFEEVGLQAFGAFTIVEPGSIGTLRFDFELAPAVVEAIEGVEYDLTVLKQAGARNHALTLDLEFDKNVTRATPGEDPNEWGDAAYRLNTILDQDVDVRVRM